MVSDRLVQEMNITCMLASAWHPLPIVDCLRVTSTLLEIGELLSRQESLVCWSTQFTWIKNGYFTLCTYKASHTTSVPCLSMHAQPVYVWQHCTSYSCQHQGCLQWESHVADLHTYVYSWLSACPAFCCLLGQSVRVSSMLLFVCARLAQHCPFMQQWRIFLLGYWAAQEPTSGWSGRPIWCSSCE